MTTPKPPCDALAPCPFCGQSDRLSLDNIGDDLPDSFNIECERCHLGQHSIHSRDGAIDAWNTRAALPRLEAVDNNGNLISADDLPRYGIEWNGPDKPIPVPMEDGYWTPYHLALEVCARAALTQKPAGGDAVAWQVYNERVKEWTSAYNDKAKADQLIKDGYKVRPLFASLTPAPIDVEAAKRALDDFKRTRNYWMTSKLKACTSQETSDTIEAILQHHAGKERNNG